MTERKANTLEDDTTELAAVDVVKLLFSWSFCGGREGRTGEVSLLESVCLVQCCEFSGVFSLQT